MKMVRQKTLISLTALAAGLFMTAFATTVLAAQIPEEKAKSIALENAGVKTEDVAFIRSEPDLEDGKAVFDVEFITNTNEEYDYEILAENGEILGIDYKKTSLPSSEGSGKNISLAQAEEIALTHAGKTADSVTFIKKDADLDDGRLIYEFEFYTANYQKYEYEVDAKSGEILAWDYDSDSPYAHQHAGFHQKNPVQASTNKSGAPNRQAAKENPDQISLNDAKAAALKKAGLKDNQVTWGRVYKEYDDGRLIYNGEFFYNLLEYEFEIDAVSGTILDWDVESIFD